MRPGRLFSELLTENRFGHRPRDLSQVAKYLNAFYLDEDGLDTANSVSGARTTSKEAADLD